MPNKPARRRSFKSLLKRLFQDFSKKELLIISIFIAIFLGASAFSGLFSEELQRLFGGKHLWGLWVYMGVIFISELVLPGSSLPLVPIMARLHGATPTAWATVAGWMASAIVAFTVARHFRGHVLNRVFSKETLDKIRQTIPRQHLFWSNVLFRAVFPVGPGSYAIALFTHTHWGEYVAASATGLIPYSFLLVWISTLPVTPRLIADGIGVFLTVAVYAWLRIRVIRQLRGSPEQ